MVHGVCVLVRGVGPQHRREKKTEEQKEQEVPEIAFDYGYMTQEGADTFPILVLRDSRCGYTCSSCVQAKGVNTYSVALMVGMIRDLGFRRILLKCDNEPATLALRAAVKDQLRDVEILDVGPPEGDHAANTRAETAVRETKRQCRSLRLAAERKLGVKLRDDHPALAWAPRFAGHVLSTVKLGDDGRTAELRRTGKPWKKFAIPFLRM